jgi:hypothetical protein
MRTLIVTILNSVLFFAVVGTGIYLGYVVGFENGQSGNTTIISMKSSGTLSSDAKGDFWPNRTVIYKSPPAEVIDEGEPSEDGVTPTDDVGDSKEEPFDLGERTTSEDEDISFSLLVQGVRVIRCSSLNSAHLIADSFAYAGAEYLRYGAAYDLYLEHTNTCVEWLPPVEITPEATIVRTSAQWGPVIVVPIVKKPSEVTSYYAVLIPNAIYESIFRCAIAHDRQVANSYWTAYRECRKQT